MQVLTAQWNWLYTRKFFLKYTDFQPSVNKQNYILLHTEKRRAFAFAFQIKPSVQFSGTQITTAVLRITDNLGISIPTNQLNPFASCIVHIPPGDTVGSQQCLQARSRTDVNPSIPVMLNYDNPSDIYALLTVTGPGSIDSLNSGEVYLWYSVFFQK